MENAGGEKMSGNTLTFRGKVDTWIVGIIAIPLGILPVAVWLEGGSTEEVMAFMGLIFVLGTLSIGSIYRIKYVLTDDHLIASMSIFRQRIPLHAIQEVYPTRNPLSAIAASLDRLAVRFSEGPRGMILVSPLEKQSFVQALADRIPGAFLIDECTLRVTPSQS